jgi:hypothetical protein
MKAEDIYLKQVEDIEYYVDLLVLDIKNHNESASAQLKELILDLFIINRASSKEKTRILDKLARAQTRIAELSDAIPWNAYDRNVYKRRALNLLIAKYNRIDPDIPSNEKLT